jgi:hypothetical protein
MRVNNRGVTVDNRRVRVDKRRVTVNDSGGGVASVVDVLYR